jgi:hypothetical protein
MRTSIWTGFAPPGQVESMERPVKVPRLVHAVSPTRRALSCHWSLSARFLTMAVERKFLPRKGTN